MSRRFDSKAEYAAAVTPTCHYPDPADLRRLADDGQMWETLFASGVDGESNDTLDVDFLPGGRSGHAGQVGNLVAGTIDREGYVHLIAERITRAAARRLIEVEPRPRTLTELNQAVEELGLARRN